MDYQTEQPGDSNLIAKAQLKRARRIAIVFGVITVIALVSLVYAKLQNDLVKQRTQQVDSLQLQLNSCIREAQMQRTMAEHATMEARMQQQLAAEALSKNLKK